jgi:hypothetical protein
MIEPSASGQVFELEIFAPGISERSVVDMSARLRLAAVACGSRVAVLGIALALRDDAAYVRLTAPSLEVARQVADRAGLEGARVTALTLLAEPTPKEV